MELSSDHRYDLTVGAAELWRTISNVEAYPGWWPWLRRFDAHGLVTGDEWHCLVQPPLPYSVGFTIRLEAVEPPLVVSASVRGDIVGTARLEISDGDDGSTVRLVSRLAPTHPFLKAAARLAPPVVRFGHDWVLNTGVRQFLARAGGD